MRRQKFDFRMEVADAWQQVLGANLHPLDLKT